MKKYPPCHIILYPFQLWTTKIVSWPTVQCFQAKTTFPINPVASCTWKDAASYPPTLQWVCLFLKSPKRRELCVSVRSVCQDKKLLCCSPKGPISHTAAVGLCTLMTAYTHTDTHTPIYTPTFSYLQTTICWNMWWMCTHMCKHMRTDLWPLWPEVSPRRAQLDCPDHLPLVTGLSTTLKTHTFTRRREQPQYQLELKRNPVNSQFVEGLGNVKKVE